MFQVVESLLFGQPTFQKHLAAAREVTRLLEPYIDNKSSPTGVRIAERYVCACTHVST